MLITPYVQEVREALHGRRRKLKEHGDSHWTLDMSNGRPRHVDARIDAEWLVMDAELDTDADPWDLLLLTGELHGGVKAALDPDSQRPYRLRAELPLCEDMDVSERIADRLLGFEIKPTPDGEPFTCDLESLIAEAGWECDKDHKGNVKVRLETPGELAQATVAQDNEALRAVVTLPVPEQQAGLVRLALGVWLLTANGVLRMARAAAEEEDGCTAVGIEIAFGTPPSPGELAHAFSALSVACRLCLAEAAVFEDETIAKQYLALRGWSS